MTEKKVPRRYRTDIPAMEDNYGNLTGLIIKTSIKEFSKICPRDQVKIKAYYGLKSWLKQNYECELILTSQKTRE